MPDHVVANRFRQIAIESHAGGWLRHINIACHLQLIIVPFFSKQLLIVLDSCSFTGSLVITEFGITQSCSSAFSLESETLRLLLFIDQLNNNVEN